MTLAPGQTPPSTRGVSATNGAVPVEGRSPWQTVRTRVRRDKVTMVALTGCVLALVVAATSPLLRALGWVDPFTNHPELVQGLGSLPEGPLGGMSLDHWFGVEPGTGRDLFSLLVTGMTTSLTVAVLATVLAVVVGTGLGIVAGYARGRVDWGISRFVDLVLSFPSILMLLALGPVLTARLASLMGQREADPAPRIAFMVLVLGFFGFPFFARVIRGQVLSLREREFVEAARSLGAGPLRICVKELLPHLWAPILVCTTLVLPQYIAAEAALGFLGVGLNPPTASLGAILNDSVSYAVPDPAYFLFPGVTVFLLVLSFNLLGDGLRDALDPRNTRSNA